MLRRVIRPVLLGVALALLLSPLARAQVLSQVPANAVFVIKINNVQQFSDKVKTLAEQWGLTNLQPALENPLASFQAQANLNAGFNPASDAAIAFILEPGSQGPPLDVALVPVTDYQAFLTNFQNVRTEGELTTANAPNTTIPVYVAHWGNYAAVAHSPKPLAQKPVGLSAAGVTGKEMQGKDIIVYANLQALRPLALTGLQEARTHMNAEMDRATNPPAPPGAPNRPRPRPQPVPPAARAMFNQMLNVAERFMQQGQAATLGANLTPEGISTSVVAEFEPSTPAGQIVAKVQNSNEPLLVGLPDEKYLMVVGGTNDPQLGAAIIDDLVTPILKDIAAAQNTATEPSPVANPLIADYLSAMKQMVAATRTQAFGFVAPSGNLGQESLLQTVTLATGDAKIIAAAQQKMFAAQQSFMTATQVPGITVATHVTPNARTVDGVSLDQFQVQFTADGKTPQAMQAAQMIAMMYGPNGLMAHGGIVDDQHYILVMGGNEALLTSAIAAAKTGADTFATSDGVKAVSAQLPTSRLAVIYVPVAQVVTTVVEYAQRFGAPFAMQLPPNLPPVGMTVSTETSAVRVDGYIPSELVQSLIAAGMQATMQMQGGQQPGAAPGGGL